MFGKNNNDFQIQPPQVDYAPVLMEGELKKQMYFDNVAYALDDWVGPVKTKYWDGAAWKVTKKTRGYTGTAFRPLKMYIGSAWIDPTR